MTVLLIVLLASTAIELMMYTPFAWRIRRWWAATLLLLLALSFGWLIGNQADWTLSVLLVVQCYRGLNLLRIVEDRMNDRYLRQVTFRTGLSLQTISFALIAILTTDRKSVV